jgi:hypothetical protein
MKITTSNDPRAIDSAIAEFLKKYLPDRWFIRQRKRTNPFSPQEIGGRSKCRSRGRHANRI